MLKTFHQYNLIKVLSQKYSHVTYLASPSHLQTGHGEPKSQVVLTVFAPSLFRFPHEYEKLLQKAQHIKQFEHQHLLPLLDMGMEGGQPFVVREYLSHGSLRDRLKKISPHGLELQEALPIILQVGEALAYAYNHGMSHGNIRPENILFDAHDQALLVDFHLVERKDAIIRDEISQEYAFCYLAPEQIAGISNAKSDQYALGCLTYELITGQVPFAPRSLASMMGQRNNAPPAPLSESVASLLPSLEKAILKAVAKDPAERFFDFSLFLEFVRSSLSSSSPAFPFASSPDNNASHLKPLAVAQEVSSRNGGSGLQGVSEAFDHPEVDVAEPSVPSSQASLPEWTGILPLSESLEAALQSDQCSLPQAREVYPVSEGGYEEVDELVANDALVQTQVSAAREESARLRKSSDTVQAKPARHRLSKRGGSLKLMVLFSVIAVVIASAFWVARTSPRDMRPPTTKKMSQVGPPREGPDVLTVQPTVQATSIPTVQATNLSMVPPTVQATSIPLVQSPSPIPALVPTPAKTYDASDPRNTLSSGARLVNCSSCPNGYRVGYIGLNDGKAGTLQFNNVSKNVSGRYTLTIDYVIAGADTLALDVRVNGGPAIALNVPQISAYTDGTTNITISLNAGNNTIEFSNPSNSAPDIDWIVV